MDHSVGERNPRLQLVEDRLGKPLADVVRVWRDDGMSWRRIARELYRQTDVSVTDEAVRMWWLSRTSGCAA